MRYTGLLLVLIILHQYSQITMAGELLSLVLLFSSGFLYFYFGRSLTGESSVQMDAGEDYDPLFSHARKVAEAIAIITLYQLGGIYQLIAFFVLPYLLLTWYGEIFLTLVYLGIIEIVDESDESQFDDEE